MMRTALFFAAALASTSAFAAARTIDDCEQIKDAMAYNACLASFGPTRAHQTAVAGPHSGRREGAMARKHYSSALGASVRRVASGRLHMEFTPRR